MRDKESNCHGDKYGNDGEPCKQPKNDHDTADELCENDQVKFKRSAPAKRGSGHGEVLLVMHQRIIAMPGEQPAEYQP